MSFRYSLSSGNWWYPWFMSSLLKTLQSLNVVMKSSVIGACTCRECCMDLFSTRRSRLTRMFLGFFGFGWTTSGEHQVMDSCSGTFSMMSLSMNSSIVFFKGSIRWYGTLRGFCAIGCASSLSGKLMLVSFPSHFALPMPSNLPLC